MCYLIQQILIHILSMKHCSLEKTYIDHKYIDGKSRSVLGEFWSGTTPPPCPQFVKPVLEEFSVLQMKEVEAPVS